MANSSSSSKRARQCLSRHGRNAGQRSAMRTLLKKTDSQLSKGEAAAADTYSSLISSLDRMARKGLIHKNKAARHKSRMNKRLHAASAS